MKHGSCPVSSVDVLGPLDGVLEEFHALAHQMQVRIRDAPGSHPCRMCDSVTDFIDGIQRLSQKWIS